MNVRKAFALFLLLLAACQATPDQTATVPPVAPLPTLHPTPAPASTQASGPLILPTAASEPPLNHPTLSPPVHEPPLRFAFPPPAPDPVSLWRPPLYPIPWALNPNDHFFFARPIAADEINWPLASYRYGGIFPGGTAIHTGIDIDAPIGTPVLAAAPGKVLWAGYGMFYGNNSPSDPYGLAVTIRHDFSHKGRRLYTIYAHMSRIDVSAGQLVNTGSQLGLVGITGNTTGPHLHFEVRKEDNKFYYTYNPELWLAPPQGWGVLVGQLRHTNGQILEGLDVEVVDSEGKRSWIVRSYGPEIVNPDEYFDENLVLSDLPAGTYTVKIPYKEKTYDAEVTIHPGAITFFTFKGEEGFTMKPLPTPNPQNFVK